MMQMAMRNEIYLTCFWKCVKKGLLIFEVLFTGYANRSESELSIFSIGCFLTKHQTSGLPPCSEFYFCSRSLSVLAVSIYFPTLSLKKPQSAKFRAALRIYDLGAKYFRALSDRNDLEFFFEI